METEPKLDRPGAGVPWPQKLIMRLYIRPFVAEKAGWEDSAERFARTTRKIRERISGLTEEQLQKRILIAPMTAIEDSSRYWSVAMALDHITIVGRAISRVVSELDAGRTPPGEADPASVKPLSSQPAASIVREFDAYCDQEFPLLLPSLKNRKSGATFRHPWFGPMKAQAWYWLLASHHDLHYRQIKAICRELNPPKAP